MTSSLTTSPHRSRLLLRDRHPRGAVGGDARDLTREASRGSSVPACAATRASAARPPTPARVTDVAEASRRTASREDLGLGLLVLLGVRTPLSRSSASPRSSSATLGPAASHVGPHAAPAGRALPAAGARSSSCPGRRCRPVRPATGSAMMKSAHSAFAPPPRLAVTEDVGEDRDDHPDPGHEQHEPEHRDDDVPQTEIIYPWCSPWFVMAETTVARLGATCRAAFQRGSPAEGEMPRPARSLGRHRPSSRPGTR